MPDLPVVAEVDRHGEGAVGAVAVTELADSVGAPTAKGAVVDRAGMDTAGRQRLDGPGNGQVGGFDGILLIAGGALP